MSTQQALIDSVFISGSEFPQGTFDSLSTKEMLLFHTDPSNVLQAVGVLGSKLGRAEVIPLAHNSSGYGPELPWHIDGYYHDQLPEYFILGCSEIDSNGGQTLLKDGRIIASNLMASNPDIQNVEISYQRVVGDLSRQKDHLLIQSSKADQVLVYRAPLPKLEGLEQVITRRSLFPAETDIYRFVDAEIERQPLAFTKEWKAGDILVAKNLWFLHTRTAYTGTREMDRAQVFE